MERRVKALMGFQLSTLLFLSGCLSFSSRNKATDLIECVLKNDFRTLQELVKEGYPINERDPDTGGTVLHYAAFRGNLPMVELLLKNGSDIRIQDDSGNTALMDSVYIQKNGRDRSYNDKVIDLLLANGAQETINTPNTEGQTPLMFAAGFFSPRIVKLMIDNGANVNYGMNTRHWLFGHYDLRPLSWARAYNRDGSRDEVIAILKAAGARE